MTRTLALHIGMATLAAGLFTFAQLSLAQQVAWPTKAIRVVVGFPGGSSPDAAARAIAEPLSRALGQPVIVDNKGGASGNIATEQIARASDDHTIGIVINGNLTSAKMLYPKLPYNVDRDFTLLTMVGTAPLVLVTRNDLPSGVEFFAAAKAAGDKWSYGSVGNGSLAHLGMELLKTKMPGLAPLHVPYQGNPLVVTGLLGKQIELALIPPGVAMPQVKSGKLKAIGVSSSRSVLAPEVAPLSESGVKDFQLEVWAALVGPANLSKGAQDRLNAALVTILESPETRQQLFNQGWQAAPASPSRLRARVQEETKIMEKIISSRGIKME